MKPMPIFCLLLQIRDSIEIEFETHYSLQQSQVLAAKQAELVKVLFECMSAFRLSHACIVRDLTPIVMIDSRVRLDLSPRPSHLGRGLVG